MFKALRILTPLAGLLTLAMLPAGCDDVDEDEGDAGAGGASGIYVWVVITDTSAEENDNGTPGVDICGVSFGCNSGETGDGERASLEVGGGDLCTSESEAGCSADRTLPAAAVGSPQPCEANSAPSDYTSVGMGGTLSILVDTGDSTLVDLGGLQDCGAWVDVYELEGADDESYTVQLCADDGAGQPDLNDCYAPDDPAGSAGKTRFIVI